MGSLQEIKRRIRSVDNTKKITKAMQLVATTKLRRSRQSLEDTQTYFRNVYDIINRLFLQIDSLDFLKKPNAAERALHIVINSSIGLCGGYNMNVDKLAYKGFKENDEIVAIGSKAGAFWRSKGLGKCIVSLYDLADEAYTYELCSEIGALAFSKYDAGEINAIYLCYTEYKNSLTFIPRRLQLFPVDKAAFPASSARFHGTTDFEPSVEGVVQAAVPLYFNSLIFGGLVESKVCENASRRNAMESATDNAQDLRDRLMLQYNRARQTAITQEISEIIAGASSQGQ